MRGLAAEFGTLDAVLALAVAIAALAAVSTARRGGRFRGLPGWAGFQAFFAALLIALDRGPGWISYPFLGLLMFFTIRDHFFVAPVRMRDRYAVLAAYLAIPFALSTAWFGTTETFLATVPTSLFLFIPVFLALGKPQEGMLDSMGRTLLGVMIFVFCAAHLALLPQLPAAAPPDGSHGLPQFLGVLILLAELPRRIAGDFAPEKSWMPPTIGVLVSVPLVIAAGFWLGPECGLGQEDAARAGFLVLVAVTMGARVAVAVAVDLALRASSTLVGRGGTLSRVVPAVYAIPVYFHYLNHFA